jgi:hypothetical protein
MLGSLYPDEVKFACDVCLGTGWLNDWEHTMSTTPTPPKIRRVSFELEYEDGTTNQAHVEGHDLDVVVEWSRPVERVALSLFTSSLRPSPTSTLIVKVTKDECKKP